MNNGVRLWVNEQLIVDNWASGTPGEFSGTIALTAGLKANKDFALKAWGAIRGLLGGEERIAGPCHWGAAFIANLGVGAERPWAPPSAHYVPINGRWHKDGDFFRHFLDSPEQALLTIVLWTDIRPRGGGTFLACDSAAPVARLLQAHPEGLLVEDLVAAAASIVKECRDFVEVTGEAGDVVLHHSFMLHTVSQNHLGLPRLITNGSPALREPMNFNREDPERHSAVERAVLRGLDVERLDFRPTAPRERVVPEREKHQQKFREEEQRRLRANSLASGV